MRPRRNVAAAFAALASLAAAPAAFSQSDTRPDEVRAMVAEMLADAETRTSLLQSSAGAGHDGKFYIAAPDGNFRLNISGRIQLRYVATIRDDTAPSPDPLVDSVPVDDFVTGFQARRSQVIFDGHVFAPELTYAVQLQANRTGGGMRLLNAFAQYDLGDGFIVRWGQFKVPFLREELLPAWRQLAVERSLTNARFHQGRSQAVEVGYAAESFRARAAFSDGFRSINTDFDAKPADWAFTGRVEGLVMGNWRQFRQFTSPRGAETGLMLGAAAHMQAAPDTGMGDPHSRFSSWTADASFVADGFNLFGAIVGRHANKLPGSSDDFGYIIHGGVYIAEDVEVFARWDHTFNGDDFRTITAGFNYYVHGHAAKVTADVQWFLDDAFAGGSTGVNFLTPTDENQVAFRLQFQLLF
ncbi:MAG: hypothetical protein EA376_13890 [Phycisphaeraceae bacterium]|nr:MAG: hypothetical protein EA376_13890 [Phycisphaeraceae bacterium]